MQQFLSNKMAIKRSFQGAFAKMEDVLNRSLAFLLAEKGRAASVLMALLFALTMNMGYGQVTVTGSGCAPLGPVSAVDGTYNLSGTDNGKNTYLHTNTWYLIMWAGSYWIFMDMGNLEIVYTNFTDVGVDPPTTGWSLGAAACSGFPAPTLTIAGTCSDPTSLTATNVTATTADLGWTAGGSETAWEYLVQAAGGATPTGSGTATSNNPTSVTGLTADTDYEFYVRSDCGGGSYSAWVGPEAFSTTPLPTYAPVVTSGSNGCSFVGTYSYTADLNGKPSYADGTGNIIFWESNKWNLAFTEFTPYYYLFENTADTPLPPCGDWTDVGGCGSMSISVDSAAVSIAADPGSNITAGIEVTFTATPTNGGGAPAYQWKKNNVNVGTNSPTYTDAALADGDVVTVVMTSDAACANSPMANSNAITMTVASAPAQNNALSFDGSNDHVALPNALCTAITGSAGSPGTQLTIEYWFKGNFLRSAVRIQKDDGDYIVTGWNNLHIISTDGGINGISVGAAATDGNWHHVAVTWQKNTVNGFKSYLDGQLVAQRNSANANLPLITSGASLGSYNGSSEFINGSLDDVRIWNTVRSQAQIQEQMSCELLGNEAGLVAYYKLNHGTAGSNNASLTTASDATANGYHGTLGGFALNGATSNWVAGASLGVPAAAEVSIAADPGNSIAPGTSVTFTATPTNGGSAPTYQWKKNGSDVGANEAIYIDAALADGDSIWVIMTSNDPCANPTMATSNIVSMTVAVPCPSGGETWTSRTAAENNSWRSVTYGSGLFVAVAIDGANRVMTSTDGQIWTAHAAAEANSWNSVTYGNGLFVAVAANGTNRVMTSIDGQTWTAHPAAEASAWSSVTYGNGLFVAVAGSGINRVMTSTDGQTWTAYAATEANTWTSVTYGNGLFVAVATSGANRVMTSTDGQTWTAHAAAEANSWNSVTYGNGLFVAVAASGTNRVMTSTNGQTWTAHAAAAARDWLSVTYSNGIFVAVGHTFSLSEMNRVMTSTNGQTWTIRAATEANIWSSVTYGNGLFAAVAQSGANRVMTSLSNLMPTVSIAADPGNSIDSGTSVTFTATPTNGGSAPTYQWKKNGNNVGNDEATYTDAAFVDGDSIWVIMTSNDPCADPTMATSNTVAMTVTAPCFVPQNIVISGSGFTNLNGTYTPFGQANGAPRWTRNDISFGDLYLTWIPADNKWGITEASSGQVVAYDTSATSITYLPCSGSWFDVIYSGSPLSNLVLSGGCGSLTGLTPSVAIASDDADNGIAPGTSVTFTATPTNGGSAPTYQWKKNGNNVGNDEATYTDAALVDGDSIWVIMTSNDPCADPTMATSNEIAMAVCSNPVISDVEVTQPTCTEPFGTITITASGNADLEYSLTPSVASSWQTSGTFSNLPGRIYRPAVRVASNNACIVLSGNAGAVTINRPISISASITEPTCGGKSDATITAQVVGGVQPYTYVWGHGPTTRKVRNLSAGVYSVTVTDARGCTNSEEFVVAEPEPIVVTVDQSGTTSPITATIAASGGTPDYTYNISGTSTFVSSNVFTGLLPRAYSFRAKDANGCIGTIRVNLGAPAPLDDQATEERNFEATKVALILFPNPTNRVLNIQLVDAEKLVTGNLTILNAFGQEVMNREIAMEENGASISVDYLPQGTYRLVFRHDDGTIATEQFVILKD